MQTIWNLFFYQPIYNALVFTINHITFGDVGFAIIIITITVKIILSPLTFKSAKNQILMKKMEPELKRMKIDYPNKEEQAKKTFEIYKKYGTNPFSGCLVVLLQLPIIFALYYVFYKGLNLNTDNLYSFISLPEHLNTQFLGLIDIHGKSLVLAILAGLSQFVQGYLSTANKKPKEIEVITEIQQPKSFQDELSSSMQMNIKYVLPVFIGFIAYTISAAVALYWVVSNLFMIAQEFYVRKRFK